MPKRYAISDIRAANSAAGRYFFSRDTMRHFGDRVSDWGVIHRDSPDPARPDHFPHRVFIRHKTRDEVREFYPLTGEIGLPLSSNERDQLNI